MMKENLSDISHQLKTPLSALFMYMEIMEGEPEEPPWCGSFREGPEGTGADTGAHPDALKGGPAGRRGGGL